MLHDGTWGSETKGEHLSLMACLFSTNLCFTVGLWVRKDKWSNGFPGMRSSQGGQIKTDFADKRILFSFFFAALFHVQSLSESASLNRPIHFSPVTIALFDEAADPIHKKTHWTKYRMEKDLCWMQCASPDLVIQIKFSCAWSTTAVFVHSLNREKNRVVKPRKLHPRLLAC